MNCDRAFCIALVSGRWLSVGLLRDPRGARHWGVFRHRIGTPKVVGHHTDMTPKTGTNEGCRSAPHRLGRFVSESVRCRLSQWGPGSVLKHKGPAVPVPMELVLLSEGELPNWTGEFR